MTRTKLKHAIAEAERFLKRAKETEKEFILYQESKFYPSKNTAATKRASMDLTRALADLRRPD